MCSTIHVLARVVDARKIPESRHQRGTGSPEGVRLLGHDPHEEVPLEERDADICLFQRHVIKDTY